MLKITETKILALLVVVLLAFILQQSMALHQSWKNERSLSQKIEQLRGGK